MFDYSEYIVCELIEDQKVEYCETTEDQKARIIECCELIEDQKVDIIEDQKVEYCEIIEDQKVEDINILKSSRNQSEVKLIKERIKSDCKGKRC